ncbi:lysophospholipid acyltransferase family protein [Chitinimonas sp.]|uniref:lysophospholipid acyltransferase family protein n=1 Tax=Chitinimonas sp. TaxID=1934313 RepID=UPI002F921034
MKTSHFRQAWRFVRLLNHLLLGLIEAGFYFQRRTPADRVRAVARWSRRLCLILGVKVRVRGVVPAPMPANTMLVANHVSWLDIFVMNAGTVARFVAKAEVRHWPLLGWLCQRTGTLFVTRERRHDTRRVNTEIADALSQGDCIAVFPEGSTTDGTDVATFNASLLQPAIEAGAQIIPVALCYYDRRGQRTTVAAYVGEMSLLDSLRALLAEPSLVAELTYLPALPAAQAQRRELARLAQQQIRSVVRPEAAVNATPAPVVVVMAPEIPVHPPI